MGKIKIEVCKRTFQFYVGGSHSAEAHVAAIVMLPVAPTEVLGLRVRERATVIAYGFGESREDAVLDAVKWLRDTRGRQRWIRENAARSSCPLQAAL